MTLRTLATVCLLATSTLAQEVKRPQGVALELHSTQVSSAVQSAKEGAILIRQMRPVAIQLPDTKQLEAQLAELEVASFLEGSERIVVGDSAVDLAKSFSQKLHPLLPKGLLTPKPERSLHWVRHLLGDVLPAPIAPGEVAYYTLPSASVDEKLDTLAHAQLAHELLLKLGFAPRPVDPGLAVVYAELDQADFDGIAIVLDRERAHVCLAFRTLPIASFSSARGLTWILKRATETLPVEARWADLKSARATYTRMNLAKPTTPQERALSSACTEALDFLLGELAQAFVEVPGLESVDLVLAGEGAQGKGLATIGMASAKRTKLPLKIEQVRVPEDPTTAVVRGALVAAAASPQ